MSEVTVEKPTEAVEKKIPTTLSTEVLKRFMSAEEFDKLVISYKSNRSAVANCSRFDYIKKPITPEEIEYLTFYVNEADARSSGKYERENNKPAGSVRAGAVMAAVKILFRLRPRLGELIAEAEKVSLE